MVVAGKASDVNSLPTSNKVSPLTREQTPQPRTDSNNVVYKLHNPAQILIMWMEYKLYNPAQILIMWSINSTTPHRC